MVSVRVLVNTMSSWAATVISGLIGVFLVPFLVLKLGKEGYGLTALLGTIIGLSAILDLGLRGALTRLLAEAFARNATRKLNELASSAAILNLAIGAAASIGCIVLAPQIARFFRVSDPFLEQGVFLVRWYGSASILLSFISPVFACTLAGLHRFDLLNLVATLSSTTRGLGLFLLLRNTQSGLYGWAAVNIAASVGSTLTIALLAYRRWPSLRLSPSLFRIDTLGPLFGLGGYMAVTAFTNLLGSQADPLILTTFLGPSAVTLYAPALALTGLFRPVVLSLADQMHPLATKFFTDNRHNDLQAVLLRGTRYTLLMGIPVCVILTVYAEPIARLWLEPSLHQDYRVVALVLAAWSVADLTTYAAGTQAATLLGMGKLRFQTWSQLPMAVGNMLLSVLLVGYTSLGVVGVVIPTILFGLLRRPIIAVHTARACGLSGRTYFAESYARPLVVLVTLAIFAFLVRTQAPPRDLLRLLVDTGAIGGVWMILCWTIGLNRSDRASFGRLMREVIDSSKKIS